LNRLDFLDEKRAEDRQDATMEIDRDYYQQRLEEELHRALNADCSVARIAHRKLADFYQQRLSEPEPPKYRRGVPSGKAA
jgi:hypothetical protein